MAKARNESVYERVRDWLGGDKPDANFWSRIRVLVESGDNDAAGEMLRRKDLPHDILELVAIVIAERTRLIDVYNAGEKAKERRAVVECELACWRAVSPKDFGDAVAAHHKAAELAGELNNLIGIAGSGDAAGFVLRGINQQFADLLDMASPPRVAIDGGMPNPIRHWFHERSLDPFVYGCWQQPRSGTAATERRVFRPA